MNINIAINEFAKIHFKYELRFPDLIIKDNFVHYIPKTTVIPYIYYNLIN